MEGRDEDAVRDMTCQRWNSDIESMEDDISNAMELEASGSGVRLEVWS